MAQQWLAKTRTPLFVAAFRGYKLRRNSGGSAMKQFRILVTAAALFGFGLVLGVSSSWAFVLPAIPAGASDGLFSTLATSTPNPIFISEPPGGETVREGTISLTIPGLDSAAVLDLIEPGTTNTVSDEISTVGSLLVLASDPLTDPPGNFLLLETGGWQDIGVIFDLGEGKVFAFSDVVPEPTTLALLGSGLFGLAMMRRRKRPRS
jgi:hypothetical protein